MPQRITLRRDGLLALQVTTWLLIWASTYVTIRVALHDHGGSVVAFGGPIGVAIVVFARERDYLRMSAERRDVVRQVRRSGIPSGDEEADRIALRHLNQRADNVRSDRIVVPALAAGFLVLTIFAGSNGGWWALAGVPVTGSLIWQSRRRWSVDPRPRAVALGKALRQETRSSPA